ncbi:hypothetical protein QWY93_01085 [Echinicola jeungdonensis]|uniref:Bacteriocin-type signal sequence n=1 Tax=Echinicola jeungdonensis TaxID=709343 RepID=A0ABV5J457_9BACT|nr:hypothetical protein [Echinicola jeungdonensis]MDN3667935.1 hypothetical protein [Echinicola jeungdonensis]
MKRSNELLEDLSIKEMRVTTGGEGVFFELGQRAHKAWCSFRDLVLSQEPENILGPTGNRYPM